jgi:hypothetical protein
LLYIGLLGIPIILLVVHLLTVLLKPSTQGRSSVVQDAHRSG